MQVFSITLMHDALFDFIENLVLPILPKYLSTVKLWKNTYDTYDLYFKISANVRIIGSFANAFSES